MPLHRFVVLLCFIASFGNALCAEDPAKPDAGRRHALKVTVLDAVTEQPVAGAEVSSREGRDIAKMATGVDGTAVLTVPLDQPHAEQQMRFDVTVSASGYAVRRVMWNANAGRVRETLPAACTVRLTRGLRVGGVVRDAQGQPVAGARVELNGSGYKGVIMGGDTKTRQEFPEVSAYGGKAPVTDENGAWWLDDFPSDLGGVTLTVIRPGGARTHFKAGDAPDLAWQAGPRLDLSSLKSGQAVLSLKEGFTVTGKVVDEAGRPVAGATLRARDAASRNRAHEFTTDLAGRFELRNWDAAKVLISAERDGYRGTTVTVPTGTDAAEAKIVLHPGQPLRLRVLDDQGNPIPGAEVMTDPNPSEQIVNWKTATDGEGRAAWLAAPDAPVKYWINAKQHGFRSVKLTADGTEHVIRFRPGADRRVNLRLRVVDAATDQPVKDFEVWRRLPGAGSGFKPWGEAGAAGEFARELAVTDFPQGYVQGYRLQVRAAGYGTWGSETLEFSNGDQDFTVKLVQGGAELPDAPPPAARPGEGRDGDSDPALLTLATQVARLLETGDVAAFAQAVCATEADWQALVPAGADTPLGKNAPRTLERRTKAVTASAERVLALARRSGLTPGGLRFDVKSVGSRTDSRSIFRLNGQELPVPMARNIGVILAGEPTGGKPGDENLRGEYHLSVGQSHQLPAGWKCEAGIRWVALPPAVGDVAVKAELRLANRVADEALGESRALSGADDETLGAFGKVVTGLLQTRDVAAFVAAIGPARWGQPEPVEKYEEELAAAARDLLALVERAGVDFGQTEMTVKQVLADGVGGNEFGSVDLLRARSLKVVLAVEGGQTTAGRSASGRYTAGFGSALRKSEQWILSSREIRWEELPEALLTDERKAALVLENYVAEHRALPPAHPAPEIDLERLADNVRVPLSAYRGKVVILEFWATWCGPCQEPMAKLQELVQAHPEWKGRVEVITVSIDSKAAKATAHLEAKQWLQTANFWAGEGEFKAASAKAFRVSGVPSSYVIGPDGKIVDGGHPASMEFAALVGELLR